MSKFNVFYDDRFNDDEKQLLEAKRSAVMDALKGRSLFWTFVEDDKQRRYYRLKNHAGDECFLQLVRWELEQFDDDKIKAKIIGGDRPCTEPPRSTA